MIFIKKGYLIRVTTWENDADNYNTKELQVETEQEIKDLVDFANLFGQHNCHRGLNIANLYSPNDAGVERVRIAFVGYSMTHPNVIDDDKKDMAYDILSDLAFELGLMGGECFTRVCDKIEVFKFDADVECEKIDV